MKNVIPKHRALAILAALFLPSYHLPIYAASLDQLSQKMLKVSFYEEAYPMLRRMVKQDPDNPETHYSIARCLEFMGRKLRAIQEYQIYLQLAPEGPRASECRSQIESWTKEVSTRGEKYTLSNLDMWFKDYYKDKPYHSWDEDPSPDWVKKADDQRALAVDVHFITVRPDAASHRTGENWHMWFLTSFHDLWKTNAKIFQAYGSAELYIRMHNNGHLEPIIVTCNGSKEFETELLSTFASFDNTEHLKDPCSQGVLLKAYISAGIRKRNAGTWWAFTENTPARPVLVSLDGTFRADGKNKPGFIDMSTVSVSLPQTPPVNLAVHKQLGADCAAQIKQAKELIEQARYNDALDILWPLGERDVPEACLLLAKVYSNKDGPYSDNRMAALWWEQAAKLGETEAKYRTAYIYEWCNGNSSGGISEAVDWYKKGAASGSADCLLKLGILSEFGDGMPCSQEAAIRYYKLAAAKGQKDAIRALARLRV